MEPHRRAHIYLIFLLAHYCCPAATASKPVYHIYWNSSSDIFDYTKYLDTDFTFRMQEQVDFICPLYPNLTHSHLQRVEHEYSMIYKVSAESYSTCTLDESAVAVLRCDRPHKKTDRTITIREFTPTPNGLEFRPGHTYHFISPSDGTKEGINHSSGGLCREKNLRMRLHIIDAQDALIANPRLPRIGGSSVSAHKQSGLISQKNRENPAIVKEYELLDEYESQAHRLRQSGSTQQTARAANFASTVDQTYQVEEFNSMGNAQVDIGRLPVTSGVVKNFPRSSFVMKLVTLPVLCLWLR